MDPDLMLKRYLEDEGFRAALVARAHRARAETVHRLLVRPLLGLLRLPFRAAPQPRAAPKNPLYCG
jgi:hypothetical protein